MGRMQGENSYGENVRGMSYKEDARKNVLWGECKGKCPLGRMQEECPILGGCKGKCPMGRMQGEISYREDARGKVLWEECMGKCPTVRV